jgi:hypothetical protein
MGHRRDQEADREVNWWAATRRLLNKNSNKNGSLERHWVA